LLHWVPSLKTNAQGKSTVEFFTSDNTGEYVVVAHGLSKDGKAGTGTYKFSVKRLDY
jgi:methionine-rich copper-binding protein CopC